MADLTALEALYKDLHQHPELSFQEHRTAGIVAARTRALGLEVTEHVARTGVVAVLRNGDGPTVWLRADMDALPVHEETGLDYASTERVTGPDGQELPVMHACGHDMHVTWLLGAIEDLVAARSEWSGTVVAVFQPAEETIDGAAAMVSDGIAERFPRPDVVLGQHLAPWAAGTISLSSGVVMASSDAFDVTLYGKGGHGSRPETTVDPVLAAASTVVRLQSVVAREVTPGALAVLTVGSLSAGTKHNIIPAEAHLGISVRTADPGVRERVLGAMERIIASEAQASGMTDPPLITSVGHAPATTNSVDHTVRLRGAFEHAFGASSVIDHGTVSGSEDVGVLAAAAHAPLVFWFTGGSDPISFAAAMAAGRFEQDVPSNHSPFFAPVLHPTLERGVQALTVAARTWLDGA